MFDGVGFRPHGLIFVDCPHSLASYIYGLIFLFATWQYFSGSTSNENLMFDDFGFVRDRAPAFRPRLSPTSNRKTLSGGDALAFVTASVCWRATNGPTSNLN
jgi:hypothetical protein